MLRSLRVAARYNVLTPIAMLALAMPAAQAAELVLPFGEITTGVDLQNYEGNSYDALTNYSFIQITSTGPALSSATDLRHFRNMRDAYIVNYGTGFGVSLTGAVGSFVNEGALGGLELGVSLAGTVGSFDNRGFIISGTVNSLGRALEIATVSGAFRNSRYIAANGTAVLLGSAASFTNSGQIYSGAGDAIVLGAISTVFANDGLIIGKLGGLVATEIDTFVNTGAIGSTVETVSSGLKIGKVGSFTNRYGMIGGTNAIELGEVGQFDNQGLIAGVTSAVKISGDIASFSNAGDIFAEDTALNFAGAVGRFVNSGWIGSDNIAVQFETRPDEAAINNSVIEGLTEFKAGGHLINSGTLDGSSGTALALGAAGSKLTLRTGSKIFGLIDFTGRTGELDFSSFSGSTFLEFDGLDLSAINAGSRLYFHTIDGDGDGELAIVDISGHNGQAIGQTLLDVLLTSNGLISGQLANGRTANAVPTAFAPALRQPALAAVDTAVLGELDTLQQRGITAWANGFGGGSRDLSPAATNFAGFAGGAHVQLSEMLTLGGMAGYVTASSWQGVDQTLTSRTGLIGLYGQAAFGVADVDFSLIAGAATHESTRVVSTNNTIETATGLYNSAFIAPSAAVTVPVLSYAEGDFAIRAAATYIAGLTSGYTETGATANLTLGSQSIGILDARIGLEGRHQTPSVTVTSRAGLYVQANNGNAGFDITLPGFGTETITTPGTTAIGVYGGAGLDYAAAENVTVSLNVDGAHGNNGRSSAAVKFGIGGEF